MLFLFERSLLFPHSQVKVVILFCVMIKHHDIWSAFIIFVSFNVPQPFKNSSLGDLCMFMSHRICKLLWKDRLINILRLSFFIDSVIAFVWLTLRFQSFAVLWVSSRGALHNRTPHSQSNHSVNPFIVAAPIFPVNSIFVYFRGLLIFWAKTDCVDMCAFSLVVNFVITVSSTITSLPTLKNPHYRGKGEKANVCVFAVKPWEIFLCYLFYIFLKSFM